MKSFLLKLKKNKITVNLTDGKLFVKFPKGEIIEDSLLDEVRLRKKELKLYLKEINEHILPYKPIDILSTEEDYALSSSQQRLWLVDKVGINKGAYTMYGSKELGAELDVSLFEDSIRDLLARHEVLRTVFIEKEGVPRQKVLPIEDIDFDIPVISFESDIEQELLHHVFDLSEWPLLKLVLVKYSEGYRLLYTMHHIISDGWSMEVFVRDFVAIYESKISKESCLLPDLRIQYKDYTGWQNELLLSDEFDSDKSYWLSKLGGVLPVMRLPEDHFDLDVLGSNLGSGYYRFYIEEDLKLSIDKLLQDHKVSSFSFFVSCFKVLLNRITAEEDLIIGVPTANRDHEDLKDLIGFFLNTLMLRDHLDRDFSFSNFLDSVHSNLIDALAHQSYPFESILDSLDITRDYNRFPISSIFLNMLDFDLDAQNFSGSKRVEEGVHPKAIKLDLECYFKSYSDGISINCVYKRELFKKDTIRYWMEEFESILHQVVSFPDIIISDINIFNRVKFRAESLFPSNPYTFFEAVSVDQTLVSRFESQVALFSDKIAIYEDGKGISYNELNSKANGLAVNLKNKIGSSGGYVSLLLPHGEQGIIGMLGVLKSGNAYVPLDPDYPKGRLSYMLEDSGSTVIVVSNTTLAISDILVSNSDTFSLINLDTDICTIEENLGLDLNPDSIAYALYTSGSTGKPKGVIQSHRGVLHFIRVYTNNLHIDSKDVLGLLSSYSFDSALMDIYGALLNGATLCPYAVKSDGFKGMPSWISDSDISILHMVPTTYRYLMESLLEDYVFDSVRLVVLGGEAVYRNDFNIFKRHFNKGALFVNGYGPTESTITLQKFLNHDSIVTTNVIPLGGAVTSTQVYLLDEDDKEVGIYEEGELVYSSAYLAKGYLNNEEITEKVFTDNPIGLGNVYRSGDIGRMLPTGDIAFIGRRDGQVKLHGRRVELLEVEQKLLDIDGVEEAVVLVKHLSNNDFRLVGYLRVSNSLSEVTIKEELSMQLPLYMVPQHYHLMEQFPLTATGKINRRSINEIVIDFSTQVSYVAPTNDIETKLVEIWEEVLDKEGIGIKDDFFELGGNSLKIIRLISKYHHIFKVKLDINHFFVNKTLESHKYLLSDNFKTIYLPIEKVKKAKNYILSNGQYRLWVLSQVEGGSKVYNLPKRVYLRGGYDMFSFKRAVYSVIDRHEILRTIFKEDSKGEIRQWILDSDAIDFKIEEIDFRFDSDIELSVSQYIENDSRKVFDLASGPLLRASLLRISEDDYVFLL